MRLGIGTDAMHIVLDSGLVADPESSYVVVEPGSYVPYASGDNGVTWWNNGEGEYSFAAGRHYLVADNGGVSLCISDLD